MKIHYVSPEQVYNEINKALKLNGVFHDDCLYRVFNKLHLNTLKKTGNDRDLMYTHAEIDHGWSKYESWKETGYDDEVDIETFRIMEKYGLELSDFIFASNITEMERGIKFPGVTDYAFDRLMLNRGTQMISVYDGRQFKPLIHQGYEFLDKSKDGKLSALVQLFELTDESPTVSPADINYQKMIEYARQKYGVKKTA